jgi:ABC-2 type transport system permease protein
LNNFMPRRSVAGLALGSIIPVLTYGGFTALSVFAGVLLMTADAEAIRHYLPIGLFFLFLYWQLMPLFMAASGLSLDTKKLLPYPIPGTALFGLEVLLRLSAGVEAILLLAGAFTGLLLNPGVRFWTPLWLAAFGAFNLLVSVGIRDLLVRLLARKGIREAGAFLIVMLAVLPRFLAEQYASQHSLPPWLNKLRLASDAIVWPWTASAHLSSGASHWTDALALMLWIAAAYAFARRQFDNVIQIEQTETAAGAFARHKPGRASWTERFYRFPGIFWRDPVAAIVEKELRTLSRSSRFRLLFLMGFSFGLVIWIPMARHGKGFMAEHFLTVVSAYAVLLLSDTLFCNALGFDRSAAQFYFVAPPGLRAAMKAKNLAAMFFLFLEITLVAAACLIVRVRLTADGILEAYCVAGVLAVLLLTIGNYTSLLHPRPANPSSSFRNSSGGSRVQWVLLISFPIAAAPAGLAYLAGYAFDARAAFYGVLALEAAAGFIAYRIGLDSAIARGERNREALCAALGQGSGPVST